jgi:hypothetical protein
VSNPPAGTERQSIAARPPGDKPAEGWDEALRKWAYELSVLKVVTYVGKAEIVLDDGLPDKITLVADGDPFVTVCNLIGGDVTNVIPKNYADDAELQEFHAKQVEKAGQVLPNNLRIIGDLITSVLR